MMLSSVHLKAWLRTCGGPCVTAPQKLPGGTVSPEHLLGSAARLPPSRPGALQGAAWKTTPLQVKLPRSFDTPGAFVDSLWL